MIHVGCAIIYRKNEILIAQRPPGSHLAGWWEFPGGKQHDGESMEACLVREVYEELAVWIRPRRFLSRIDHAYPHKTVALHFYICDWVSGAPAPKECFRFAWAAARELYRYRFPPADHAVLAMLRVKKFNV